MHLDERGRRRLGTIAGVMGLVLAGLYYWAIVTGSFGTNYDEAVYAVTGLAILEGHGYRLISQVGDPFQVLYPPLYPLLMLVVWLINPAFPANVMLMKAFNVAFAIAILALTYHLVAGVYQESRRKAALVTALVAVSTGLASLMDYAMSEMTYLACVMLALWWIEPRLPDPARRHTGALVLMALVATLPTMARTVGIAVALAVIAWLLLRRAWKPAAVFAGAVAAFNVPWVAFTAWAVRQGTEVPPGYTEVILQRTDGLNPLKVLAIPFTNAGLFLGNLKYTLSGLLQHAGIHKLAGLIGLPFLPALLGWGLVILVALGFIVSLRRRVRVMHLYLAAYVGILMVYPYPPYTRFVAVLIPMTIYYMVEGGAWLIAAASRPARHRVWLRPAAIGVAALALGLVVGSLGPSLITLAKSRGIHDALLTPRAQHFVSDHMALAAWSREALPAEAVWLNECDPCSYLLTRRKSLVYRHEASYEAFNRQPVYMIVMAYDSVSQRAYRRLTEAHPDRATLVFEAPHGAMKVYRLARNWPVVSN